MNLATEAAHLNARLFPPPRSLHVTSEALYYLRDQSPITVTCPAEPDAACTIVRALAHTFWDIAPAVMSAPDADVALPSGPEAFALRITSEHLHITAATPQGIRYAMQALRQIAEPEPGLQQLSGAYILPCLELEDAPAIAFRGLHICFFPTQETSLVEVERQIRLAAALRYNYVILESWGVFRYPSHPEFCFPGSEVAPETIRGLVTLGKSLGVTLIPQLNIFGHASAARICAGKHALLDAHPEYAPLFEPDGWCWCLSNPATRSYLTDLVLDLINLFDSPPFFHLGCDEADNAQVCVRCRRSNYTELLCDHLRYFEELLRARNIRPMIWHDMFVPRNDPAFDGYVHNGSDVTVPVLNSLSHNFILCDWRYDLTPEDHKTKQPSHKTLHFCLDHGFDTIGCPWYDYDNIFTYAKAILQTHAFGFLQTTWHHPFGAYYAHGSWAAWNPDASHNGFGNTLCSYNAILRSVHHNMHLSHYTDFGSFRQQISAHHPID